jgi:putative oxidoreductase
MNNIGLLFFRISVSLLMIGVHGLPKFNRLFSGDEIKFFDPFGIGAAASLSLAVFSELFLSIFIILGIFTRLSSVGLIITMFIAAFLYHAEDPFRVKEKAILFLISYIFIFITGPGRLALQNFIDSKIQLKNKYVKFLFS